MLASYSEGAWRVVAVISARKAVHPKAYGLRLFEVPSVLTGKHTTVIYEAVEAANDATQILTDADEVVPRLTGLFGTDRAASHPVIFVVSSRTHAVARAIELGLLETRPAVEPLSAPVFTRGQR